MSSNRHANVGTFILFGPQLRAVGLVLPLVAFIGLTFVAPLATMLARSVYDPVVADALPETLGLLQDWDGTHIPPEPVFEMLARELRTARQERTLGRVATRINRVHGGLRSVITRTARRLRGAEDRSWRDALIGIHAAWDDVQTWHAIRRAGQRFTARHYLHALDLERRSDGHIAARPDEYRVYVPLLWRTLVVSLSLTGLCLLLGYPVAYLIAHARRTNLLLLLVLVPFWTSLLVRTTAWIVLLQTQGVINTALVSLGLIADASRLAMVYNMTGTMVAMTHVLLPFMVLPLYAVMRTIPRLHLSAAASLGAGPVQAFWRVYWPQTLPGVGAGALLVFILAIGFYITPALVGGRSGQLIANMIAYHMQSSLNWGLAAALGGLLLAFVLGLYLVYNRLVGIERMRLG